MLVKTLLRVLLLASTATFSGCAFVDNTVAFNYQPTAVGPLSEVQPLDVWLNVTDERPSDTRDRIGDVKNGYGAVTARVIADRPVEHVIYEAISGELALNGHTVVEDPEKADALIQINITRLFTDTATHFFDIELTADIVSNIGVGADWEDLRNNTFVLQVNQRSSQQLATESARTKLFNKTLQEYVTSFAMEQRIVEALMEAAEVADGAGAADEGTVAGVGPGAGNPKWALRAVPWAEGRGPWGRKSKT